MRVKYESSTCISTGSDVIVRVEVFVHADADIDGRTIFNSLDSRPCELKRKRLESFLWPKPQYQQKIHTRQRHNTTRSKICDYTTIAGRLKIVFWSKYIHPTCVVNRYDLTSQLPATVVQSKGYTFKKLYTRNSYMILKGYIVWPCSCCK